MFLLSNLCLYFIVIMWIQHALLPYRINDFRFSFSASRLCLFLRKPERDWGLAERRLVLLAFSASCLCFCLREARTWLKTGRNCCRFGRSYLHRRMICERGWSMRASVDVVVDWYVLLDHIISLVGRITCTKCKEAAYCYQCPLVCGSLPVSVCFCMCLLVTAMSCARTAEPVEMSFGMWTPKEPSIRCGIPQEKGQFWGRSPPPSDAAFRQNSLILIPCHC